MEKSAGHLKGTAPISIFSPLGTYNLLSPPHTHSHPSCLGEGLGAHFHFHTTSSQHERNQAQSTQKTVRILDILEQDPSSMSMCPLRQ